MVRKTLMSAPIVVRASIAGIKTSVIVIDASIISLTGMMKATAGFVFTYSNKGGIMEGFTTLPTDGTLKVRISDNILDKEDWPVIELTFSNGKIVSEKTLNKGAYAFESFIGWDRVDLLGWLAMDSTGQHPETYHSIIT
jgi:hypothetical protein